MKRIAITGACGRIIQRVLPGLGELFRGNDLVIHSGFVRAPHGGTAGTEAGPELFRDISNAKRVIAYEPQYDALVEFRDQVARITEGA